MSERQLRRALRSGGLVRLRRDSYASPAAPTDVQRAVGVGGSVACVSALAQVGGWRPPDSRVHIVVARNAARFSGHDSFHRTVRVHWASTVPAGAVQEPAEAVAHLVRCQPRAVAIAVLDSVLRASVISVESVREAIDRAPRRCEIALSDIDPWAESGIESLVRVALRDAGLRTESQVVIAGVGRVDLLVEGRVIVEVDGREWHRGEQARDYRRDLEAMQRGYRVVRVDYPHALERGDLVVAAVRRALSARHDVE